MPIITFSKKEDIPSELHSIIKEEGGAFKIDVAPKESLTEFRDNNIELSKERDDLKNKVEALETIVGEDPTKFADDYKKLVEINQKVADGKLKATDDISKEVETRFAAVRTELESKIAALTKAKQEAEDKNTSLVTERNTTMVETAIREAALSEQAGMNPAALVDIIGRGSKVFEVNENKQVVAVENGTVVYGADGVKPMTPLEWIEQLKQDAPYLAKPSNGGDAGGSGKQEYAGLSQEEFNKLSSSEKLKLANRIAS